MRHHLFVLLSLLLSGCNASPPSGQPGTRSSGPDGSGKTYRIAVIPKGTTHEFWKSVHYGAAQAGREFGAEIVWQGPLLEQDCDGQITVVQNFTRQHVDGICLAPIDSRGLVASVKEAHEEGVPVVIFDSGLDDESSIVSYVATDNWHGGELAADEIARRLPDKGNIVLLRYMVGSESTAQREEGFLEKIKTYPRLKVISSDQYSLDTPQKSLDKAQQMLNKFGDQIDGLFSVCEPNAAGTLRALQDAGMAGKIVFVGFDPNLRMVQALADDEMQGIVLQDPVSMGYQAVKTMVEHLQGKPVEKRINTGEAIATPENKNEPRMLELLSPKQFED